MAELEAPGSIFDGSSEIESLFEDVKPKEQEQTKEEEVDLFAQTPETEQEKPSGPPISLFDEGETKEEEATDESEESFEEATPYGEVIQTLISNTDGFLVYEGDEEGKKNYSKDEFIELFNYNVGTRSQQIVEQTFEQIMSGLSPTAQKLLTGELRGVKIQDIIADVAEYQEVEEIPSNPSESEKEKIVKLYYKRMANERGKDNEWVTKQIEKIIDRGDLDSEFEDAKDVIQKDLDEKIARKAQEVEEKKKEKEEFKKYHAYFVGQALSEDNLFGLKLTPTEKNQVATVLSTFAVRPSDKKEKLGITAMIDNFIHSENPKESYKILALMALAGSAPDKLIEKLRSAAETKVTKETVKKLKVAATPTSIGEPKKQTKKAGSIFG